MTTPLTETVCQKIDALFAPGDREAARQLIAGQCGANLPLSDKMGPDAAGFDRIRFAVLKLSGGDLEQLKRALTIANTDWRDTLVAAGFGHDVSAHLKWNPEFRHPA